MMRGDRQWRGVRRGLLLAVCAAALLSALGGRASATTGPYILRPPKYRVSLAVARLYRGRYTMTAPVRSVRLRTGHLGIEVNDHGYLDGVAQFEQYDAQGQPVTWVATLYDFRNLGHGSMQISILGPGGNPLLALLRVTRDRRGNLAGELLQHGRRYPIRFRRTATTP